MPRTVIHYTDSTGFGGAEVSLLTLLEGLDRRHWSPVLFHHGGAGIRLLLDQAARLNVRTRQIARVAGLFDLLRLVREVRSENASVFHAHLPWALRCGPGLVAATLARVPAVIATQQLFRRIGSTHRLIRNRLIAAGVDRYIAVSSEMADMLHRTAFLPRRKVVVIRNAVDVRRFGEVPAGALRSKLERVPGRPIVLTVARLDPQKGLGDLLEAAAQVPDSNFAIAGEGPDRERLEGAARSLGLHGRVTFLGHRDDVADLLGSCDVFVLPSLYEGFPLSVVEAMAAGKPVIATAVGGTPEAVSDGETGLLVPPGNPSALAAAIRSVISDPGLGRRLGRAGRERALREFSAEEMVRHVVRLYEGLLKAPSTLAAAEI
jgi:glycosyltransferase involved in cell wall biosynthesis